MSNFMVNEGYVSGKGKILDKISHGGVYKKKLSCYKAFGYKNFRELTKRESELES